MENTALADMEKQISMENTRNFYVGRTYKTAWNEILTVVYEDDKIIAFDDDTEMDKSAFLKCKAKYQYWEVEK